MLARSLLATDQVSAKDVSRMAGLPVSPHTTLSPPSRKPVLPSFELPQRDTHSTQLRSPSRLFSWVVSQSQACSAAQCIGSWHRLTLQLLLSPVSTSGRGRRCGTTFCCVEHDGRRMGCRASCEHRESGAVQESGCYYCPATQVLPLRSMRNNSTYTIHGVPPV